MKNVISHKVELRSFHIRVEDALTFLKEQKLKNNRIAFDRLMEELLPEVKEYINRQFTIALNKKTLPKGKYKLEDFTDELYIQAFDHIQDLIESDSMGKWLFAKADEILEDTIVEEDFDSMFFKNLDEYTKEEQEAMEEIFTIDGDGDLVLVEDLDDLSYSKQNYTLEDTFINHIENDLIDEISENMDKKEIHRHIESFLFFLPFNMRTIFELSIYHKFQFADIAKIKNISIQEVDDILTQTKNIFRSYFLKRLA